MSQRKKQIREGFRRAVFSRDRNTCRGCGHVADKSRPVEEQLDAHHITDRHEFLNGGYVKENGISLCPDCHAKAEVFHSSGGERWAEGFLPDDLYRKIGSCLEKAKAADRRLV